MVLLTSITTRGFYFFVNIVERAGSLFKRLLLNKCTWGQNYTIDVSGGIHSGTRSRMHPLVAREKFQRGEVEDALEDTRTLEEVEKRGLFRFCQNKSVSFFLAVLSDSYLVNIALSLSDFVSRPRSFVKLKT